MIGRLNALRKRHEILQARIQREQARPLPDSIRVTVLKKLRLRLREEIHALERLLDRGGAKAMRNQTA